MPRTIDTAVCECICHNETNCCSAVCKHINMRMSNSAVSVSVRVMVYSDQ